MLLKGEALPAHLERNLAGLYVVYGDEPLLTIEAGDAIRAAARRAGFSEREVLVAGPGFAWGALHAAGGNMSLFGDRKLIDLRIPTGKPGRDGGDALKQYCANLAPGPAGDTLTLITLPELGWQEEKTAWFTALVDAGVVVKLNSPGIDQLPGWIAMRLKRQGQSAERDALDFIAERVEGNLLAAHQEIQKLGLLFPAGALSLDQVCEAVLNVARYDIDGLREALLLGDVGRYARILDGLRQEGEAPPLVLWAVTEEVRLLLALRQGQERGRNFDATLKDWRVWGGRQQAAKKAASRLTTPCLTAALAAAADVDRSVKGMTGDDPWVLLLRIGLSLASEGARGR
jgi:DNA polymerase-3 subunit delta